MRFPPSFLDEIRARLPVSDVVGRRVKLRKEGREWKGLSPFNKERTPSFYVNDQKGFYHCFSSGKHGDQFSFVMETEGVSFPEAVERLAQEAGIPMPVMTREAEEQAQVRKTLYEVMELAARFFEGQLQDRVGAKARAYLGGRDLGPQVQVKFRLGYAPAERYALKEALGKQGVSVEDMIATGLLIAGHDIPVPFDRFRDRVMFPISDMRGRIIAFGGRALEKDVPAKYLNSPETELFHKGSQLYNGHAAREAAHKSGRVIAVEGYVDVIAMVTAGIGETVAPLGTALTADQIELMWKLAPEPILLFDGDKAGQRAAHRAIDVALPLLKPGKSLLFATLPEGQDPDDLIRVSGREAMDQVLASAQPLASVLFAREVHQGTMETPERRAAVEAKLGALMAQIGDENVRRYYRDDLFGRLAEQFGSRALQRRQAGRPQQGGWQGQGRGRQGGFAPVADMRPSASLLASGLVRGPHTAIPKREAMTLAIMINHPFLLDQHAEQVAHLEFRNIEAMKLRDAILEALAHGIASEREKLLTSLENRPEAERLMRTVRQVMASTVWSAAEGAAVQDVEITWNQLLTLYRRMQALSKELKEAERVFGDDPSEANERWLIDVKTREAELSGIEALVEGFGVSSGRVGR